MDCRVVAEDTTIFETVSLKDALTFYFCVVYAANIHYPKGVKKIFTMKVNILILKIFTNCAGGHCLGNFIERYLIGYKDEGLIILQELCLALLKSLYLRTSYIEAAKG